MSSNKFDHAAYRRALGNFATGVAVVTTLDSSDTRVGITVNSFSSVSLEPPLVLWSISAISQRYDVFVNAEHFAINILANNQRDICEKFAARDDGEFNGLDCAEGIAGVPILRDCSAVFECRIEHRYEGGDHTILVGRVRRFEDGRADPLMIYRGKYLD